MLYLNEKSLVVFETEDSLQIDFSRFFALYKKLESYGFKKINVRPEFFEFLFLSSQESNIHSLYNLFKGTKFQNEISLIISTFVLPFIEEEHDPIQDIEYKLIKAPIRGKVFGFYLANVNNTIAISLNENTDWETSKIKIFNTEDENEILEVSHVSNNIHIEELAEFIVNSKGEFIQRLLSYKLCKGDAKRIKLSSHHGKDKLTALSKKLIRLDYVEFIINSIDNSPRCKNFIQKCYQDGKIEVILINTDAGYGLILQSIGRDLIETLYISKILEIKCK